MPSPRVTVTLRPGEVFYRASPALFARDLDVADHAVLEFGGHQEGTPSPEVRKTRVFVLRPYGKQPQHAPVAHAQHLVDGVRNDAAILDPVRVALGWGRIRMIRAAGMSLRVRDSFMAASILRREPST